MQKYNLLSGYNISCMYMFSGLIISYWVNSWVNSLEETISPTLNLPLLPIVLCIKLRFPGLSHIHFSMPIIVTQSLFGSCLGNHVGETSYNNFRRHNLKANYENLFSWPSQYFCPLFCNDP